MKVDFSEINYFKRKNGLIIYSYQGTGKTTSEDIYQIPDKLHKKLIFQLTSYWGNIEKNIIYEVIMDK